MRHWLCFLARAVGEWFPKCQDELSDQALRDLERDLADATTAARAELARREGVLP